MFVVLSNSRRSAATLIETKSGPVLVTDASAIEGEGHPRLLAYVVNGEPVELPATVTRRDAATGLAILAYAGVRRPSLALAEQGAAKNELVTAIGHAESRGFGHGRRAS